MSELETTQNIAPVEEPALPGKMVFTLAAGTGLSVASIYYSQPMLGIIGPSLGANLTQTGLIPTLTQIGYALGILFLIPLGDRFDRRTIILLKSVLLTLSLLLCGFAPGIHGVLLTSLLIGATATLAQDIVPASAALSPAAQRGKTVGTVMTGLLVGILLSRVVSGVVAEYFGWRAMYQLAAVSVALVGLALWRVLPRFTPGTELSYPQLLLSMRHLWLHYKTLRRAALSQGLLSVAFSAFWSTLAIMLNETYHLGSGVAGAFGLAGAAGALAAPLAGKLADKQGPALVTQIGSALVMVSFAAMFLLPLLSPHAQIALIVLSAIGFDLGVQATLVSHQSLVYGLDPAARGRLNALLFTVVFIGMAVGSALGSKALELGGWQGVIALATLAGAGSLIVRIMSRKI
ncbi:MFS transporter [Rouxiella badensis]|jgi:predicted MFS family arabinose efflux permease|uniref:MFS transporter n=1 Tax=Rouxiella badensis TaxID=1646377 RepID=A0A1X0WHV1_9GAMM|nr:MFS transporter [Rouxiella badensis]MCC3703420.1 MFS transporter [Rouxiella badensis]MCC3718359.1 MFS transporter [Rouxiella badensis]MCC3726873.1 MFS transporter [Rouxiella badensis]MCC3731843.1 MFS transporter [Rouxiella badensis]MCC3738778.1 MFS transporter [Rouxiella badensis]